MFPPSLISLPILPASPALMVGLLPAITSPPHQPLSTPLCLPLSSASLSAQLGLQPGPPASPWWGLVLGSRVAWGDSERLECGKGGGGLGSGEPWGGHEGSFLLAGQSSATSLECRPLGHAKLMTSRCWNARCSVSSGGPPGGGCCAPNALNSLALPSPACSHPPLPIACLL